MNVVKGLQQLHGPFQGETQHLPRLLSHLVSRLAHILDASDRSAIFELLVGTTNLCQIGPFGNEVYLWLWNSGPNLFTH